MVSLGYLKSAERLTVVVIKARNLPAVNIKGTGWCIRDWTYPYVELLLHCSLFIILKFLCTSLLNSSFVLFQKNRVKSSIRADTLSVVILSNVLNLCFFHADPYVKVYLLMAGKRVKKKKTTVRKGTLNPVFNEAVSFDISVDAMNSVDLLLSVMHENEVIGCVSLGAHATGKELGHWREVRTANKPVAHWHVLQDPKKFY